MRGILMSKYQEKGTKVAVTVMCLLLVIIAMWGVSCNSYATTETSGTTPPASAGAAEVTLEGLAFSPATLNVTAGTTVTWRNRDGVAHTVTADDNSFDSGYMAGGASFSHAFTEKGTFAY